MIYKMNSGEVDFADLACGVGGFRLGLERASSLFNCVWSIDISIYSNLIYKNHWNDGGLHNGDIRQVSTSIIPEHDLLCAGFPCQSFSAAGSRKGFEDTRGTIFFEIARIIRDKRPKYLLLENVRGLLSNKLGETFYIILETLDELGYDCQWQVLNSKDFDLPQFRERVFIIGHSRGEPRPAIFPITKGIRANIITLIKDTFQKTIYSIDGISPTLREGHGDVVRIWDNERFRKLTPTECERLQGFPDGWTEGISDGHRYICLGNAVSVNIIEHIGRVLIYEM